MFYIFMNSFLNFPILSTLIFLPIATALLLLLLRFKNTRGYYAVGFIASFVNLALSCLLLFSYNKSDATFQFSEIVKFSSTFDIKYFLGIDGLSLLMIVLTAFLTPICLAISVKSIEKRVKEYVIAFLLIEGFVIGSFCALDLLFFYIFFEATLIPMFLVIGIWGGENRIYAAYKFFLYTLAGSVLLLIAIILIFLYTGTTDVVKLSAALPQFFPT